MDVSFFKGKKVLVTGHTGFKGAWLCELLLSLGADVTGYALLPTGEESLFSLLHLRERMTSYYADIRDRSELSRVFSSVQPELVLHLAAQPIVSEGYRDPVYTYETNVMGTVYLLDCIRQADCVRSCLNVTTDKVYANQEWEWSYRENDVLDGFDPYANSKSCSELVTHSYCRSYFADRSLPVSTARAGNVIGGGDFALNRILPDCVRAALEQREILVRNPASIRPYQHVLEPLYAYLMIVQAQYEEAALAGAYNVGPGREDCVTTGELVSYFCECWGQGQSWRVRETNGPHEAGILRLDSTRLEAAVGWKRTWGIHTAVDKTVEWTKAYQKGRDMSHVTQRQIEEFLGDKS